MIIVFPYVRVLLPCKRFAASRTCFGLLHTTWVDQQRPVADSRKWMNKLSNEMYSLRVHVCEYMRGSLIKCVCVCVLFFLRSVKRQFPQISNVTTNVMCYTQRNTSVECVQNFCSIHSMRDLKTRFEFVAGTSENNNNGMPSMRRHRSSLSNCLMGLDSQNTNSYPHWKWSNVALYSSFRCLLCFHVIHTLLLFFRLSVVLFLVLWSLLFNLCSFFSSIFCSCLPPLLK